MPKPTSLLPGVNHFISLNQAVAMTTLYRSEKENILIPEDRDKGILPICETFDRGAFDYLLAEEGCMGIRLYYSMDDQLKVHIITVGVNADGEDMLPSATTIASLAPTGGDNGIVEEGQRCPDDCPPDSPLNG